MMSSIYIDERHKNAKQYTLIFMKLLRENLHDQYQMRAIGRVNMRIAVKIQEMLSKWISVLDARLEPETKEQPEMFIVTFKRHPDFRIDYNKKKVVAAFIR